MPWKTPLSYSLNNFAIASEVFPGVCSQHQFCNGEIASYDHYPSHAIFRKRKGQAPEMDEKNADG